MSYRVSTDVFEGPFDLLLHLVGKKKVDVHDITVSDLADSYLEHIDRMRELDLDVASEFLLLAATLLEIKAAGLLPPDETDLPAEFEDLSPEEARRLLVARLLAYRQFKNASAELAARMEAETRTHRRSAPLEEPFLRLMPDFLEGVTLRGLAVVCADLVHRREVFLLQAEHVASVPISLEQHVESVCRALRARGRVRFSELVAADSSLEGFVATFLAVLELYKRSEVELRQDAVFGDIEIVACGEAA